jgi:hypothetical protein
MATQIISKDEANVISTLPMGKKHPVRILIEALKPGEILRIDRADFTWKRKTPGIICRAISRSTKAKFRVFKQPNKAGWLVERLE